MVETKTPEYWEAIAKQGDIDRHLRGQLQPLFTQYREYSAESIFSNNSDTFTPTFQKELNTTVDEIFSSCTDLELPEKEIKNRRKVIIRELREYLILIHRKKALCEIAFPAFPLLKFVEAFSNLIDECVFQISSKGITIIISDPSRICAISIKLYDKTYIFYQKGKLGLNLDVPKI